ncbi:FxsA family protein [Halostreptopolyspora alba]|uniref:FxsA family protein n=1 Tax=Halostreptopolyspora alba TaxID=2487137 RepID=A0A3N0EGA2_9ACTN|nr:FxsA family protein [Nocardiopsaceae bacterium YIM 96095]
MPLLIVLALMALPFVEIWLMILAGQQVGVALTIAALFALSVSGVFVLRGAGTRTFREADEAMRTGTPPQGGLLDTLMVMVGGVLLLIPGFVTGVMGAALALPFTRPALRWAFVAWAERRVRRMAATPHGPVVTVRGPGFPGAGHGPGKPGAGQSGSATDGPGSGRVVPGRVIREDNGDSTG